MSHDYIIKKKEIMGFSKLSLLIGIILSILVPHVTSLLQLEGVYVDYLASNYIITSSQCGVELDIAVITTSPIVDTQLNGTYVSMATISTYNSNFIRLSGLGKLNVSPSPTTTQFTITNSEGDTNSTTISFYCINPYVNVLQNIKYVYNPRSLNYFIQFQGALFAGTRYNFQLAVSQCYDLPMNSLKYLSSQSSTQVQQNPNQLIWLTFNLNLIPLNSGIQCNYSDTITVQEMITGTTIILPPPIRHSSTENNTQLVSTHLTIPPNFSPPIPEYTYTAFQTISNYTTQYRLLNFPTPSIIYEAVEGNYQNGVFATRFSLPPNDTSILYNTVFSPDRTTTSYYQDYVIASINGAGNFQLLPSSPKDCTDFDTTTFTCRYNGIFSVSNINTELIFAGVIIQPIVRPFGIVSGTLPQYTWTAFYMMSPNYPYSDPYLSWRYNGDSSTQQQFQFLKASTLVNDTTAPIITSITITELGVIDYLVSIKFNDDVSGIYDITFTGTTQKLTTQDLVYGSITNGIFEKRVELTPDTLVGPSRALQIIIRDQALNVRYYTSGSYLATGNLFKTPSFKAQWSIDSITYMSFKYQSVDVTNVFVDNTLYINVSNADPTLKPMIELKYKKFPQNYDKNLNRFTGYWNPNIKMYQIDFTIPKNIFEGVLNYQIINWPILTFANLFNRFGSNSTVYIISDNGDILPPYISLSNPEFPTFTPSLTSSNLAWNLTIIDRFNGFHYGWVNFTFEYGYAPISLRIDSSNLVEGDIYNGIYTVMIKLDVNCRSQNLILSSALLYDTAGNYGYSWQAAPQFGSQGSFYDPLDLSLTSGSKAVYISCNGSPPAITPTFDSLNPGQTGVDVGIWPGDRIISVSYSIGGVTSFDDRAVPIFYLQSLYDNVLTAPCTHAAGSQTYYCTIQVPYGWGYQSSLLIGSVYGVTDTYNNLAGYTDIRYTRSFTPRPYIESYSQLSSKGGDLTISGRAFSPLTTLVSCWLSPTIGNCTANIARLGYTLLILSFPSNQLVNQDNVSIVLYDGGYDTNLVTIPLSEPPVIPQPLPCPGSCTGHGICNTFIGECDCNDGFSGVDCSMVVVDVDTIINGTSPILTSNDQSLASIISLVSVKEMSGVTGQPVLVYPFTSWNASIVTGVNPLYLYTTLLNGTSTRVNVTIQQFTQTTTIWFAGETTKMTPHTIKIGINMDSYQFQSPLNYLDLVMSVEVNDQKQDSGCNSNTESGDLGQSSQYLKFNIADKSLFGKFIKKGVVDSRVVVIKNTFTDTSSSQTSLSQQISLSIPNYKYTVNLDPQFNYLVDPDGENECNTSSKKLTNAQIVGIVVGSVAAALLIVAGSIYILKKKYRITRQGKIIKLVSIYTKK